MVKPLRNVGLNFKVLFFSMLYGVKHTNGEADKVSMVNNSGRRLKEFRLWSCIITNTH